jgi:tetratricopeptide (TPR) repeat protein
LPPDQTPAGEPAGVFVLVHPTEESQVAAYSNALAALLAAALSAPGALRAADAPASGQPLSEPQPAPGVAALVAAGEAQLAEGKADEAVVTLERAVAADPKSTLARTRLGGARLMRQEYGAAIQDFRSALAADPNNADAFVGMAVAYLHSGDYALARAALGEARRLAPAKGPEIDEVLGYLDRREEGVAPPSQ